MENEVKHRLRQVRKINKLSMRAMSDKTGIPQRTIDNYERGINPPSFDYISIIHTLFGVNAHWLLTGDGSMLAADQLSKPQQLDTDRLESILAAIHEYSASQQLNLTPDQISRLAARFYQYFDDKQAAQPDNIINLDDFRQQVRDTCALAVKML